MFSATQHSPKIAVGYQCNSCPTTKRLLNQELTILQATYHACSQYHVFLLAQDARRSEIFLRGPQEL
jgi:hypothetical protein